MIKKQEGYILHEAAGDTISPVVFDNPHSGTVLPAHFKYACSVRDLMELHDPHVEKLLVDIPATGSPVLEALIHRTCIDLNRDESEIDPATIIGGWNHPVKITPYVTKGLGLFPLMAGPRINRISPIYNQAASLTTQEARLRIDGYYVPYYKTLDNLIDRAHKEHGTSLYIDMHSMGRQSRDGQADIILGDLYDQTCDGTIRLFVEEFFKDAGYSVDRNGKFFKGGALIEKTAAPANNRHSLQIEMARDLYMDQDTLAYDPARGSKLQADLTRFAKEVRSFMVKQAAALKP
ncbi:MAG: N-formylglutamate amidohydrolase [Micavibrio sp.]